ncbi:hypothetical protein R1flu_022721 [Riccia fluitans]|uniref:Uncharacterized protein n=1 Tax=Riccia fluitans TaxID=41844 RepID=A0ABD1XQ17_9MARC
MTKPAVLESCLRRNSKKGRKSNSVSFKIMREETDPENLTTEAIDREEGSDELTVEAVCPLQPRDLEVVKMARWTVRTGSGSSPKMEAMADSVLADFRKENSSTTTHKIIPIVSDSQAEEKPHDHPGDGQSDLEAVEIDMEAEETAPGEPSPWIMKKHGDQVLGADGDSLVLSTEDEIHDHSASPSESEGTEGGHTMTKDANETSDEGRHEDSSDKPLRLQDPELRGLGVYISNSPEPYTPRAARTPEANQFEHTTPLAADLEMPKLNINTHFNSGGLVQNADDVMADSGDELEDADEASDSDAEMDDGGHTPNPATPADHPAVANNDGAMPVQNVNFDPLTHLGSHLKSRKKSLPRSGVEDARARYKDSPAASIAPAAERSKILHTPNHASPTAVYPGFNDGDTRVGCVKFKVSTDLGRHTKSVNKSLTRSGVEDAHHEHNPVALIAAADFSKFVQESPNMETTKLEKHRSSRVKGEIPREDLESRLALGKKVMGPDDMNDAARNSLQLSSSVKIKKLKKDIRSVSTSTAHVKKMAAAFEALTELQAKSPFRSRRVTRSETQKFKLHGSSNIGCGRENVHERNDRTSDGTVSPSQHECSGSSELCGPPPREKSSLQKRRPVKAKLQNSPTHFELSPVRRDKSRIAEFVRVFKEEFGLVAVTSPTD